MPALDCAQLHPCSSRLHRNKEIQISEDDFTQVSRTPYGGYGVYNAYISAVTRYAALGAPTLYDHPSALYGRVGGGGGATFSFKLAVSMTKRTGHRGFGFVTFADVADRVARRSHEICGHQFSDFSIDLSPKKKQITFLRDYCPGATAWEGVDHRSPITGIGHTSLMGQLKLYRKCCWTTDIMPRASAAVPIVEDQFQMPPVVRKSLRKEELLLFNATPPLLPALTLRPPFNLDQSIPTLFPLDSTKTNPPLQIDLPPSMIGERFY
ncbi:RRM domain-containing protein [Forsythia ovata]|uniref:RRM domain-containing protein n=1 Tax=Forsythia ovata TaxID=205694 RepID=A0ABD1UUF8_9LAMI